MTRMYHAGSLSFGCALILFAVPERAQSQQETIDSLREELRSLRATVEALESRLQGMEKAQLATTSEILDLPRSRLPPRQSVADPSAAASRVNNVPPPTEPVLKGFLPVPGTTTRIRFGGYAKLDAIYGDKAGNPHEFITSQIPVVGRLHDDRQFSLNARQTRFSFEARRPTDPDFGSLRFYLESDFYGSADNYAFRLRHAYGQLGNLFAGFGYSSFVDSDSLPETLDFQGPNSAVDRRLASFHYTFDLGDGGSVTVSAEDPDAQLSNLDTLVDQATNRLPDLVLMGRIERDWGHVQLGTLFRRLSYSSIDTQYDTFGGGVSLSGSVSIGRTDLLLFGGNWGEGIARYIADLTGRGLDAAVTADGSLQALPTYGVYVGYTHYWREHWRSNLVYGVVHLDDKELLPELAFHSSHYAALNFIWSPAPTWTMGAEVLYGRHELQDGRDADATRIQGSVKYNFVR